MGVGLSSEEEASAKAVRKACETQGWKRVNLRTPLSHPLNGRPYLDGKYRRL
jgi:hypothetical protein